MFTKKVKNLYTTTPKVRKGRRNAFLDSTMKESTVGFSAKGARKYTTTGSNLLDQFGKLAKYKPDWNKKKKESKHRPYVDIVKDCEAVWREDKHKALKFIFYLRTISRKTQYNGETTKKPQKGAGMRYESIMRMIWLLTNHPKTFWKNIRLFIAVGSWKDIFEMLRYDLEYHKWEGRVFDWNKFLSLIKEGLEDENSKNLILKYIKNQKSRSKTKTLESQAKNTVAKWLASKLFGRKAYEQLRKLKASGNAHQWQQKISKGEIDKIDFDTVAGKAITKLTKSKFLKNQKIDKKFVKWAEKETTKIKTTDFIVDLFENMPSRRSGLNKSREVAINKQFNIVLNLTNKMTTSGMIVVMDTSGSMTSNVKGYSTLTAFDVAKAIGMYCSKSLKGDFSRNWIEFGRANTAIMRQWGEGEAVDMWYNYGGGEIIGTTNFQGVPNLFAIEKRKGIPEEDFPTGILCLSDGQFDPSRQLGKTNVEAFRRKLRDAGFSRQYVDNFRIVLWDIPTSGYFGSTGGSKFETKAYERGTMYMSGYDASVVSFLKEGIKSPMEIIDKAFDQELLNKLRL